MDTLHWGVQWSLRLALAAPLLAILFLGAFRFGLMDFRLPLLGVAVASLLAALALALAVWAMFWGGVNSRVLVAAAVAVAFLFVPLSTAYKGSQVPPIHDISTDLDNVPKFVEVPKHRAAGDNSLALDDKVQALQREHYKTLRGKVLALPPAAAFDIALGQVQGNGWQVLRAERGEGVIEASVQTPLFGFVDDVLVRVSPHSSGGAKIDMRSASRVGVSDLGANAARIEKFLATLNE